MPGLRNSSSEKQVVGVAEAWPECGLLPERGQRAFTPSPSRATTISGGHRSGKSPPTSLLNSTVPLPGGGLVPTVERIERSLGSPTTKFAGTAAGVQAGMTGVSKRNWTGGDVALIPTRDRS